MIYQRKETHMRAVVLTKHGPPEVLQVQERPDPRPGPGEIAVDVRGAGGVGVAATQIAKAHGVEVWGTASPGKHETIRALGVDHPIDYTRPGWEQGLPKLDLVMDAIGGRSFRRSYDLLRPGGRLICF